MAITVYGVEANLDVVQWSGESYAAQRVAPSMHGVLSGFVPSVATGNRVLSVSGDGHAYVPGARVVSDAAVSVTLDANSSGVPRIDTIVLQVDWSGTAATAGSVIALAGTPAATPVRRTLTQDFGVLWQIPLAHVTVANGATQLVAGNIVSAYPQADTGRVSLTLPSGYAQTATPLAVRRFAGVIEFGGIFTRSGANVAAGGSNSLGVIIPETFRPARALVAAAFVELGTNSKTAAALVATDGTVTLYPISGNVATGNKVRIDTTWLTEV